MSIFIWFEVFPAANIRAIDAELLDPRFLDAQEKQRRLNLPPAIELTGSADDLWIRDRGPHLRSSGNGSTTVKSAKIGSLDKAYFLHQFNGIHRYFLLFVSVNLCSKCIFAFRFLGVSERQRMLPGGGHVTPMMDKHIIPLNDTVRSNLETYFKPFNKLLVLLLEEKRKNVERR
jgi:hypothetical protein